MERPDYVVKRDDIYVGRLVWNSDLESGTYYPHGIFAPTIFSQFDPNDPTPLVPHALNVSCPHMYNKKPVILKDGEFLRRGTFIIDDNMCANDLLYDAPHYPIQYISTAEMFKSSPIWYFGKSTFKMDKILQYFNFPEEMTYEDVLKMEMFFRYGWMFKNIELFGYTENYEPGCETYEAYDNSVGHNRRWGEKSANGEITYNTGAIPNSYFKPICRLSNKWDIDNNCEIDLSLPHAKEGEIRKLVR